MRCRTVIGVDSEDANPEIGVHPSRVPGELARAPFVAAEYEHDARILQLRDFPLDDRFGVGSRLARLIRVPALFDLCDERRRKSEIGFGVVQNLWLRRRVGAVQQIVRANSRRPVDAAVRFSLARAGWR